MGKIESYILPFVGLSLGKHLYNFDIADAFFENLSYSEVKKGNLKLELTLDKQSNMLLLDFHIKGTVHIPCDRCMDNFDLPIECKEQLIVKIGGTELDDNEEMLSISATEYEINIAQPIYEYIILSLPYRRIHPPGKKGKRGCNPEVIKKLEEIAVNTNTKEVKKEADPRWDALRNFKL